MCVCVCKRKTLKKAEGEKMAEKQEIKYCREEDGWKDDMLYRFMNKKKKTYCEALE